MAKRNGEQPKIRPSLLARLVLDAPSDRGGQSEMFVSPEDYLESIRGDLEDLLNTRYHVPQSATENLQYTTGSLVNYGLPDATHSSSRNPADREAIRRAIERSIEHFDTRLKEVAVEVVGGNEGDQRSIVFRVDAIVDLKPAKGRVFFDASLNLATSRYEIADHFGE